MEDRPGPAPRAVPGIPPGVEPRRRVTFDVDQDLTDRVRVEAAKMGLTVAEFARQALLTFLEEHPEEELDPLLASKENKAVRQQRFLDQVKGVFEEPLAADLSGVSQIELESWCKSEKFFKRLDWAKDIYLANVQLDAVKIGRGEKKGNPLPLMGLLNSHHYAWGRVKVEMLRRTVDPMVQDLINLVSEEFPNQNEALQRILDKFARIKEMKLAAFSK